MRTGTRGVTLIELMLVMMILIIMAGVAMPRFSDFFPALQVRESADGVFSWALKCRSDAALTGARHRLVFEGGKYRIEFEARPLKEPGVFTRLEGSWGERELPGEVQATADPSTIDFRPDGTATAAVIELANDRGDKRVIRIEAATSQAVIEEAP